MYHTPFPSLSSSRLMDYHLMYPVLMLLRLLSEEDYVVSLRRVNQNDGGNTHIRETNDHKFHC